MRDLPVPDVPIDGHVAATVAPHVASMGAIVATMAGWLPVVVAIIPAVYYLILIWEMKTTQRLVNWILRRKHADHPPRV